MSSGARSTSLSFLSTLLSYRRSALSDTPCKNFPNLSLNNSELYIFIYKKNCVPTFNSKHAVYIFLKDHCLFFSLSLLLTFGIVFASVLYTGHVQRILLSRHHNFPVTYSKLRLYDSTLLQILFRYLFEAVEALDQIQSSLPINSLNLLSCRTPIRSLAKLHRCMVFHQYSYNSSSALSVFLHYNAVLQYIQQDLLP